MSVICLKVKAHNYLGIKHFYPSRCKMFAEVMHQKKSSRVIFTFLFFILKTVLMLMLAAMCKGMSFSHSGLRDWCAIPWQPLVAMEKCVFPDSLESGFQQLPVVCMEDVTLSANTTSYAAVKLRSAKQTGNRDSSPSK